MGSPPHARGTGNPPKLMEPCRPSASSRSSSLGPTYIDHVALPRLARGRWSGVAVTAIVALAGGWRSSFGLDSPIASSLNPGVFGMSADEVPDAADADPLAVQGVLPDGGEVLDPLDVAVGLPDDLGRMLAGELLGLALPGLRGSPRGG